MSGFHGQRPDRKQGVGIVMPWYSTEGGIMHGGVMAWPGTTTALEKMVVPAHTGHMAYDTARRWCGGVCFSVPNMAKSDSPTHEG